MHSPLPEPGIKLLLLGGFDARLNGFTVGGISYNKMRALLAYLAVEREQDHPREVLAELFWPDSDPTTARGNLRRTLSDLRRVLEQPAGTTLFSTSKHTLRFIANCYVDVQDFTATAAAQPGMNTAAEERTLALYRGEFLAGLSLPDSPDFEVWLQIQRETLHRRALALIEQLSNHHAQGGEYGKALQFALRYIELEPWDEHACRRAMRLYASNGQHSAAMSLYAACCSVLKNELGVMPGEETRQLAEQIRRGEWPGLAAVAQTVPAETVTQRPAERRQVTVLYCELSSDAIDDPDEAMALLDTPQARCMTIIRQFAGHIVQSHGGGLLAYFGFPQAREDAARRAVQAALTITQIAAFGIEIRVGVHTGLVITGGDTAMPDTVGKTSRLAIQLRQKAGPDQVAISQNTHSLVAGYVDCVSLGVHHVPGLADALEVYKVVRESGARTRLEAAAQLSPLVGRQAELSRLLDLWAATVQALSHGAHHIALVGEAGMGKSRLLLALKERLHGQPHTICELRCFPEFSQSPFQALIAMLEAMFGFAPGDTADLKCTRLAQFMDIHFPALAPEAIPLFSQLLSLRLGDASPVSAYAPQKQKERTIALVLAILQALAHRRPMLFIVEDLHWSDPSTLEMLHVLVEKNADAPILTVLTARPQFEPPWQQSAAATLALKPLDAEQVTEMIASLRSDMPATNARRIVARADGVPLFVEELIEVAGVEQASVPASLHDLLAARMDNTGAAKYTAQLAATLGREFNLDMLSKVFPGGPAALGQTLNTLQEAGLIARASEAVCQFKHALIQEAAYQSQTKAARQAAHQRIAQVLQSDFPMVAATQPELVAQHLSAGGAIRPAIDYWIRAGQRAAMRSANTEATEHFKLGLQHLMTLAPSAERDRLEFALCVNLGATLCATLGYGAAEAGAAYARALELGEALEDRPGLFTAMWGMWLGSSSRVGHMHALELAKRLLHLAEQGSDLLQLQKAHYAMGNSLLWTGQPHEAQPHQERAMALYQPAHHELMVREFGENIHVSSGAQLAWVLWLQGYPDQARRVSDETLALAQRIDHPYSLCYAKAHGAGLARWMGTKESTRQLAEEAIALGNQYGFPLWLLAGVCLHGWVLSMRGETAGIAPMGQGIASVRIAFNGIEAYFLGLLAEAHLNTGQVAEALSVADAAQAVMNAKEDRFLESEILRFKGECLLKLSDANATEAEVLFHRALAISRSQGAKSLELRAAMSLARLWQSQRKLEDARLVLREIYSGFTEGFDTPDLQEARGLLAGLDKVE